MRSCLIPGTHGGRVSNVPHCRKGEFHPERFAAKATGTPPIPKYRGAMKTNATEAADGSRGKPAPLMYRFPRGVIELCDLSRAGAYRELKAGRIKTVMLGSSRYVTHAQLVEYVALLEREAKRGGAA